jgi:nicotinate-nucleotide--dimethylbenzimidazole phosphoribosyltransferase
MAASGLPFDDIRELIAAMPGPDMAAANAVRTRDKELTKPAGSLGRMEEIAEWLAAWQGKGKPTVDRPLVCVFAGNHGVVAQGVSAFPQAVTRQMLENFAAGGAAINQICAAFDLGFKVFDLALDLPTGDFTQGDALDERACVAGRRHGSALSRRDGHRQHHLGSRDLRRALRWRGGDVVRARYRPR